MSDFIAKIYDSNAEQLNYPFSCDTLKHAKVVLEASFGLLTTYDDRFENDKFQIYLYELDEVIYSGIP